MWVFGTHCYQALSTVLHLIIRQPKQQICAAMTEREREEKGNSVRENLGKE